MNSTALPYPVSLCASLLNYAVSTCDKTNNLRLSEIKDAMRVFFTDAEIERASQHALTVTREPLKDLNHVG